ncbi:MAG TPA: alpha-hydroxy acid oxidase [Caulobacteraceae bacterium]|jgi:isopentenyl diphosphate isomerase/L-lactate dehydrogenase-like FMN-dependent dehydrogenase|nr:alpha-hydroxy acid oxidase [Caulobacteraceae bacterium]
MPTAPLNLFDYERLAKPRLHPSLWDYIAAGAADEITVAENRRAFDRRLIRPRVLADVSHIDTATTVLGSAVAAPIMIAPSGPQGAISPAGEIATVRAAGKAGALMVVPGGANRTIEAIGEAAVGPLWLQLYLFPERERTLALVRRAEAAGYRALVLTVDSPRFGRKDRSLRSEDDFHWPESANLAGLPPATLPWIRGAPATWVDVDWLRASTSLPILLKGILTGEDAVLSIEHGVAGVVVSNHGGRQLDGVIASFDALPEVADAVNGRCEVYLDGGVRRGTDVLKALAVGARAVLVGRPILWGLAVSGEEGVADVLSILQREFVDAMSLSGRPTIADVDRALLA